MEKGFETLISFNYLTQQMDAMYGRLEGIYREAHSQELLTDSQSFVVETFKELGTASEELQVACEELRQQNEALAAAREQVEAERQRYQNLFELAPDAYLVTDSEGVIQEANRAASQLFQVAQRFLIGKPIANFVPEPERRRLRTALLTIHKVGQLRESTFLFQPRQGSPFTAAIVIASDLEPQQNRAQENRGRQLGSLRWLIRDLSDRERAESVLIQKGARAIANAELRTYHKGEVIPLEPKALWWVHEGVVKLSTFAEGSEEILVGLAGPAAVFGADLTSLPTYQALALSEVCLEPLSWLDIAAAPRLAQALLPRINQRLRQTEALLALSGRRYVKDRLHQLLLLLKQEVGQSSEQGTCLDVRLTHDELASACGTTRVTITRLLSEWRRQGWLRFERDRRLVLNDEYF